MIEKLVLECIEKHKGGEKFFDELDSKIKESSELYSILCDKAFQLAKYSEFVFITSGKFGVEYNKWLKLYGYDSINLEGG